MPNDALSRQVGGDHYKDSAIQPIQFAMANRYDPCIFSAIKYVTRHHLKSGLQDVRKGAHFVQIKEAEGPMLSHSLEKISVKRYCAENKLGVAETHVIARLHAWAVAGLDFDPREHSAHAADLLVAFDVLAEQRYGVPRP